MSKTTVLTDNEPLEKLFAGATVLYKAVSTTMGPRGSNVIFRKNGKKALVTHDGVTVAKMVKLNDPAEDIGADLLREAAQKLEATTGDGTTTVTVLTYHILKGAIERIRAGENPMALKKELDADTTKAVEYIKSQVKEASTRQDVVNVASIAAGDVEIGYKVGSLLWEAGVETPVVIDSSTTEETTSEVINGFKVGTGAASPYLLENTNGKLEMDNPYIIVMDGKLQNKEDMLPILKLMSEFKPEDKKFLLVVGDITGDALSLMVVNRLKRFAEIAVARVPSTIVDQTTYLKDVAIATGATVMSRNTGASIMEPDVAYLGSAAKVLVERDDTVIVDGAAVQEDYDALIDSLKETKGNSHAVNAFNKQRLEKLNQRAINIKIGATTETEAEEKFYRYEDAVGAARAAMRSGTVPGAGTTLFRASQVVSSTVLGLALTKPHGILFKNAGVESVVAPEGKGIDVTKPELGVIDLREHGIIDPAESEIEAVKTAAAVAGLLMTSGALIVDEESDEA